MKINYYFFLVLILSGNVFAETYSTVYLPQLVSYRRGEAELSGSNTIRKWEFEIRNVPVTLPDSELDYYCSTHCRLVVLVPSSSISYNKPDRHDLAFALTYTIGRFMSIRNLLEQGLSSGSKYVLNENINGYVPREGCAWTQIDSLSSDYAGTVYSESQYKEFALQLPKLQEAMSGCVITSPGQEYCAIDTVSLDFDFGTVSKSKWNATTSQVQTLNVYCTEKMKYKIRSIPKEIALSNGGSVDLFIDNKPSEDIVYTGAAGINKHEIKVSLSSLPTITGPFSGSGALVVSYP